ncbi:MAG: hypothetical protein K9N00_03440 [Candidatus Marinimicrobia bacterium]|nr:hypothetical protein [Candidatus Neomarinimicrobiota bacterium]
MRSETKNILIIGWDGFDQRNQAYSEILSAKCIYVEKHYSNRLRAFIAWFTKSCKSKKLIQKYKPEIVIIKNTHFIIATVFFILKQLFGFKLVFDSHTSSLENIFSYPAFIHRFLVKHIDMSIVTNQKHAKKINEWRGTPHIVHFPPIDFNKQSYKNYPVSDNFNICYIHTYSSDEPYFPVTNAIQKMKDISIYITGNPKKSDHELIKAPNIFHTGFLSREQYIGLLKNVDVIMVLTTRENTMQKGGNEGVFLDKPLITSNTTFLIKYFNKGCVYVNSDQNSIYDGITKMKNNYNKYKNEIIELKRELSQKNKDSIAKIKDLLKN